MLPKLCQFANCQETRSVLRVNTGEDRVSFCSFIHAAAWCLRRAVIKQEQQNDRDWFAIITQSLDRLLGRTVPDNSAGGG